MSLFMPPISPIKDENTGKTVKSATLTPFRTMSIDEVHRLITSDQRLAELTLAIRNAAAQGDEITARFLKQQTLYNPQIEMFARFKMKSSFHKTKRII